MSCGDIIKISHKLRHESVSKDTEVTFLNLESHIKNDANKTQKQLYLRFFVYSVDFKTRKTCPLY